MKVSDRVKLDLKFDPVALQADLVQLQDSAWIEHFVKQNFEGDWSVIPLRGPAGATHPVMMIYSDPTCTKFADTPFLEQTPYIREVLSVFACPLQAVRLMRLAPGSRIKLTYVVYQRCKRLRELLYCWVRTTVADDGNVKPTMGIQRNCANDGGMDPRHVITESTATQKRQIQLIVACARRILDRRAKRSLISRFENQGGQWRPELRR